MRTVVVTGSAGSGTSSVALGLAHRLGADGRRTVLVRPSDGVPQMDGSATGVTIKEIDTLSWGESAWEAAGTVRGLLGEPWTSLRGHSVLPIPGLRELAWWAVIREVWHGPWDAVVIDAGPVDNALPWLMLPDECVGVLRRAWPLAERAGAAAGRLEAGSWHLRAMARFDSEAAELADQLRSGGTSVQLVTEPRRHQLSRALQALTPLALYEHSVTDIIVNRVDERAEYDHAVLEGLAAQLPTCTVRHAAARPVPPAPSELGAEIYPDPAPSPRPPRPRVGRSGEFFVWHWPLPFADPSRTSAVVEGDDLVLTAASARRVVPIPSVLRRCRLIGVVAQGQVLVLRFSPIAEVWPQQAEEEQ